MDVSNYISTSVEDCRLSLMCALKHDPLSALVLARGILAKAAPMAGQKSRVTMLRTICNKAQEALPDYASKQLADSQYDNPLLVKIAGESPAFFALLMESLFYPPGDAEWAAGTEVLWLGSLVDGVQEHTQVQLVLTQDSARKVDEND